MSDKKRRIVKLVVFFIELVVLVGLLGFLYIWQSLERIDRDAADPVVAVESDSEIGIITDEEDDPEVRETLAVLKGYTNIAIFGVDNRSNGNTDSGNSDVVMIASINNDTKEVRLVSVYRDTYLDVTPMDSSDTLRKCNAAYARGGAMQAIQMLNKSLDLNIRNYVTVDFKAVTDLVDIVGGVEIEVDKAELVHLNNYITETAKVTGATPNKLTSAGVYNLDGNQATAYCRIRATKGDDYKRSERQREVLTQIIKKLKKSDLGTVNNIINTIFPEVSTSYTNLEILELAASVFDYELAGTVGFPFSKAPATPSKAVGDVVVPCDLESNVIALHHFLFGNESYTPSSVVKNYSTEIINNTGKGINSGDNKEAVEGTAEIELDNFDGTETN